MSCKYNKEIAAAKSGMSAKTARKYLLNNKLPSEMKQKRHWQTRSNIFSPLWHEIEDMLSNDNYNYLLATTIITEKLASNF